MRVGSSENGGPGDGFDLEELLRKLTPTFSKILGSFRIPYADRDDRVQNVLVQFVYKQRTIRTPEAWLAGALRNECRMYLRTIGRSRVHPVDAAILELIRGGDGDEPEKRVVRHRLSHHISTLPHNCQTLLRMRYKLGMDVRETAQQTGYRASSIDKVTKRCVDKLGRRLNASGFKRG